jgi:hypothetical protein
MRNQSMHQTAYAVLQPLVMVSLEHTMMETTLTSANNSGETLRTWARSLPPADKQKAEEAYVLSRLLDCEAENSLVDFPLNISCDEKPDFLLTSAGRVIGLEVTRFEAEQLATAESIRRKNNTGMPISPFDFRSPRRTNTDLQKAMQWPQVGLSHWSRLPDKWKPHGEEFADMVRAKITKISEPELKVPDNWLLVEDRMYNSVGDYNIFLPYAFELLSSKQAASVFERIWILTMTNEALQIAM